MKAHEILLLFPADHAGEIFQHLYERDKPAYRASLDLLASRRKLRTVVLDRKPRPERHAWMHRELSRKGNNDAATEVLQTWLLGAHQALICEFLDTLEVPHNGNGLLESLPTDPGAEKLQAAVDRIFQNHPAPAVTAYLQLFAEMDIAEWPSLKDLLQRDTRLGAAQPTPTTP